MSIFRLAVCSVLVLLFTALFIIGSRTEGSHEGRV